MDRIGKYLWCCFIVRFNNSSGKAKKSSENLPFKAVGYSTRFVTSSTKLGSGLFSHFDFANIVFKLFRIIFLRSS